jgi:hypothetical protein
MKRLSMILLLAASAVLAPSCSSWFMDMNGDNGTSAKTATREQALEVVQAKLTPFSRRGIMGSKELFPSETAVYYLPEGKTEPENTGMSVAPLWIFSVGPDANANGREEWLYVFVNALNGSWTGRILSGELQGVTWEEIYAKTDPMDNFTLFCAETTGDPKDSKWNEIRDKGKEEEVKGTHAWVRRFDSAAELEAAGNWTGEGSQIDWNTRTLLLVAGVEMSQNWPYDLTFTAKENGHWEIGVCRVESDAQAVLWWTRAVLVDKLPADAALRVKTTFMGK